MPESVKCSEEKKMYFHSFFFFLLFTGSFLWVGGGLAVVPSLKLTLGSVFIVPTCSPSPVAWTVRAPGPEVVLVLEGLGG